MSVLSSRPCKPSAIVVFPCKPAALPSPPGCRTCVREAGAAPRHSRRLPWKQGYLYNITTYQWNSVKIPLLQLSIILIIYLHVVDFIKQATPTVKDIMNFFKFAIFANKIKASLTETKVLKLN